MKWKQGIAVGAVALLFGVLAVRSIYSLGQAVPVMADMTSLPTIILDPGHGGIDGGAVGVDDIVEKDINLSISLTLRDMLVASGFDVIMTRETDISIHDDGVVGTKKQKTSDLRNRLALVNDHPGAVFISIHQNKFGSSKSWGAQVFFGPKNDQSERLANILQSRVAADLQPENHREYKKAEKNLYLLFNAQCPSVLLECGFLSNASEAHLLIDPEYQSKLAFSTYCSILDYLDLDSALVVPEGAELVPAA